MAMTASPTQLGCGRDIDQVWDHLDQAPDAHELACPYCSAARTDLQGLAQATENLRRDDATNPDLQPSPRVLDRILAVARAEVRRGRRLPLDQPDSSGTTPNTVSEQAVTAVVRRVGDRTRQIEIRRCAITSHTPSARSDVSRPAQTNAALADLAGTPTSGALDPGPAAVTVSLRVSVAHDLAIADASNQLRDAVIAAVAQEVGMVVVAVDVVVEDVHDA